MPSFTWPERTSSTVIFTESPIRMFSPNFLVRTSIVKISSASAAGRSKAPDEQRIGKKSKQLDPEDSRTLPGDQSAIEAGPRALLGCAGRFPREARMDRGPSAHPLPWLLLPAAAGLVASS